MREVYWACFVRGAGGLAEPVGAERVSDPGRVALPPEWSTGPKPLGAGTGFATYPQLRTAWSGTLTAIREVEPRAVEVALLAVPEVLAGRVLDPEQALPVYVRDDVVRPQTPGH
jgi:tRNA threonylcarbamoyladenosine biosynthesis protein TsaB